MRKPITPRGPRGGVQPGFLDVIIVAALAAILLYAAVRQFPAYNASHPSSPAAQATR